MEDTMVENTDKEDFWTIKIPVVIFWILCFFSGIGLGFVVKLIFR